MHHWYFSQKESISLLFLLICIIDIFLKRNPSVCGTMSRQLLAISLVLWLCAADSVVLFSVESQQGSSDTRPRTDRPSKAVPGVVTVGINMQQAVNTIRSHFVGVTVDSHQIRYNWNGLDFRYLLSVFAWLWCSGHCCHCLNLFTAPGRKFSGIWYECWKRSIDKGNNHSTLPIAASQAEYLP